MLPLCFIIGRLPKIFMINLKPKIKLGFGMLVFFSLFFVGGKLCQADESSRAYFNLVNQKVGVASEFKVQVLVDAAVPINAVDLQITYPADKLEILNFDKSHSIINFWQTGSVPLGKGHLDLTGGILKSFTGNGGLVAELYFKTLEAGDATLSFERSYLYLANGNGVSSVTKVGV